EKTWRRMAAIVTRCRPDCWGALFRGGFSIGEPMEPRCVLGREGNLSRVVLGKDVSLWIALATRSSNLVPCARPRASRLMAALPAARVPATGGSTRLTGSLGWPGLGTGVALSASASPGSIDLPRSPIAQGLMGTLLVVEPEVGRQARLQLRH